MLESIILTIAAFITSTISAIIGMGGGIILLGIMAIIIPQGYMVIALHGIIQLISNTTRTFLFRKHLKKNIINEFIVGALLGIALSIGLIFYLINHFNVNSADQIDMEILKPLIGLFIIWNITLKKYFKKKVIKTKNDSFIIVGFLSGLASIFIGATGPLIAPFFINKKFSKENIIANKAAFQMITHLSKIPIFIYFFNFNYFNKINMLLPLIIAVFIGTNFGKKILTKIPEDLFMKIIKMTLALIAIKLILEPFI